MILLLQVMGHLGFIAFTLAVLVVHFGPKNGELCGFHFTPLWYLHAWLDASFLSVTILDKSTALTAGVLGSSIGRVLLDTCNGQTYNPSQYFCLVLPGEIFANFDSCTCQRSLLLCTHWQRNHLPSAASERLIHHLQMGPKHCVLLGHLVHAPRQLLWLWAVLHMAAITQISTIAPPTTLRMGWYMVLE